MEVYDASVFLAVFVDPKLFMPYDLMELDGTSTLALRKGGCFGIGISQSLSVSNRIISSIDGLKAAEACVHKSPI